MVFSPFWFFFLFFFWDEPNPWAGGSSFSSGMIVSRIRFWGTMDSAGWEVSSVAMWVTYVGKSEQGTTSFGSESTARYVLRVSVGEGLINKIYKCLERKKAYGRVQWAILAPLWMLHEQNPEQVLRSRYWWTRWLIFFGFLEPKIGNIQIGNIPGWSKIRLCHCTPTNYEALAFANANEFSASCPPVPFGTWATFRRICLIKRRITFTPQGPNIADLKHCTILYGRSDKGMLEMIG